MDGDLRASVRRYVGGQGRKDVRHPTPNYIQKAPAASVLKLVGRIRRGMKTAVRQAKALWRGGQYKEG
jgi:hypothetical protein